jgi:hypothetical protein
MGLREIKEVAESMGLEVDHIAERGDAFRFLTRDGRRFVRTELLRATPEQIRRTLSYGLHR